MAVRPAVDWAALVAAASEASARAYAPYSGLRVGAAAVADDGRVVAGCNVENASFGLTLCAECAVVSQLHVTGGGRLVAVVCVAGTDGAGDDGAGDDGAGDRVPLLPCGRCRQLLSEHGGPDLLVGTPAGPVRLAALLPDPFGPADLGRASP